MPWAKGLGPVGAEEKWSDRVGAWGSDRAMFGLTRRGLAICGEVAERSQGEAGTLPDKMSLTADAQTIGLPGSRVVRDNRSGI